MKKEIGDILLLEGDNLVSQGLFKKYKKVYAFSAEIPHAESLSPDLITNLDKIESSYLAGKIIDQAYKENIDNKEASLLNDLMGDSYAYLIIKKSIIMRLEKLICSFLLADRFIKKYNIKGEVSFVPADFPYSLYQFVANRKEIIPDNVLVPAWYVRKMRVLELKNKYINTLKIVLYPTYLLTKMRKLAGKTKQRKNYEYGIHIWNSWIEFALPPYRIDMVESQECVNKSNTIYIVDGDITQVNLKKIKSNGFDICIFKEMLSDYPVLSYFKGIYPLLSKIVLKLILNCKNRLSVEPYLMFIQGYSLWKIFDSKYSVKKYLTFQEPGTLVRSLCHKMNGSKSIFIVWSTRIEFFYRKEMDSFSESYYGFLIYDALISSRVTNSCYRKNNNIIGDYIDCGVFLSDKVFQARHNPDLKIKLKEKLGIPIGKRVIGFCDTTMGRSAMLNIQEGSKMFDDVYRLIESDQKYQLVYKNRGYGRLQGVDVLKSKVDKLIAHERVSYVNELMPGYFAYDFMGICDVVIAAFPSSAILESSVGGVPTICYIPSERFDKEVFVVTRFPNFSARNYDELERGCKYWLDQSDDNVFQQFQGDYLKKYVDAYCDGKASERLQFRLQNFLN